MSAQSVTLDQIVDEAINLLKERGLDQVTLRNLAARLGIKAPSLYWHIENKDVLYREMSRVLYMSMLKTVPTCERWQDWLLEYGISLWQLQRSIPDWRRLLVLMPVDEDLRIRGRQMVARNLEEKGMPAELAGIALEAVQGLITGWTHLRDSWHSPPEEEALRKSLQAMVLGWEQIADAAAPSTRAKRGLKR